jgi:biotin operon repressor
VWLPQWLEERPEVSEKAKKLYAYLTYFAGGKGYAWPSFNHLAGKLHISRRYVIKLVQELSAHGLIVATSVNVPTKGHCTNHYRFLWHPWMQTVEDGDFRMVVREEKPPFRVAESHSINRTPSEQQITTPSELENTSPSEPQITSLVIPSSPKENNGKRTNNKGKVPVTFSKTVPTRPPETTASPPPGDLSDTTKIVLERRIAELRREIGMAVRKRLHDRAVQLHTELAAHQTKLGFTPDDPPRGAPPPARKGNEPELSSDWPSPEEVRATFNELRRSMGLPIKP